MKDISFPKERNKSIDEDRLLEILCFSIGKKCFVLGEKKAWVTLVEKKTNDSIA